MTRILVQRGSASGSSSNPNRSSLSSSSARLEPSVAPQAFKEDEIGDVPEKVVVDEPLSIGFNDCNLPRSEVLLVESIHSDMNESRTAEIAGGQKVGDNFAIPGNLKRESGVLSISERVNVENEVSTSSNSLETGNQTSYPPPPPVPPPKTVSPNFNTRRSISGSSNDVRIGPSRRPVVWPVVSTRTSPTGSRPSSPRSRGEEGYNSADEQRPEFLSSYDDSERERQFESDIRRVKGLEVKGMLEDGNCLFRAIADQVYGDPELYDLARQMCIDYMERERDHFTQFITEGFSSYCKRKRRDKVYGNNLEIQAFAEMYNRPIHIHSYSTEPINIFHGSYNTDSPPIRLSYHHGNHYNSLVDPRRITVGAGLGFSCLRGTNVDNVQVKAAVKAQQDQQIDNALLAEGRFYSDLELTEKEIERMVMEASRSEFKQQQSRRDSSTSSAEPSSSGTSKKVVISGSMEVVLSMGFSYLQVIEAYSIFGEDVDSMVCYLLEADTTTTSRRKGKATE